MRAERSALLWALVAIALWGTLAAVVGHALDGLAAAPLLFWSFLFAATTLAALHLARGGRARDLVVAKPSLIALGLWGIFGYHALFFEALANAPIVEANLLNYLWPLLMVLLAPALAGERTSASALAGALVGFAGAALVVTQGHAIAPRASDAAGYALAALAALSWSSFSVLLRRMKDEGDRMPLFVVWSLAAAALFAALRGGLAAPPARTLLAAAWLGVGPMAIAFTAWDRAMRLGRASTIGALSYLDPLLSTLCVAFALGKPLTAATLAGMALIVGGAAAPALLASRTAQT